MQKMLTRAEVAELLGVPAATVAEWAVRGTGPRYYKVGKHARYDEGDVLAWLEEHQRGSADGAG